MDHVLRRRYHADLLYAHMSEGYRPFMGMALMLALMGMCRRVHGQ